MPQFSVIIPTFNRCERLLRAVTSSLAQRYEDYEIIVVDDGSTDGTKDALATITGPIRFFQQPNRGPAAARSAGVRAARGNYVAFLDSDDTWFPWTLELMAKAIDVHGQPSWLYGGGVTTFAKDAGVETALVTRHFPHYAAAAALNGLMPLPTGVAIQRTLLLSAGAFRESLLVGEDVDLWFRIADAPGFVLIESPPLYVRETTCDSQGEDMEKAYVGMLDLVSRERAGEYGGSRDQILTRRYIIRRQLAYYAVRFLEQGKRAHAARFCSEGMRLQFSSTYRQAVLGVANDKFWLGFLVRLASPSLYAWLKSRRANRVQSASGGEADPKYVVFDRDRRISSNSTDSEEAPPRARAPTALD